MLLKLYPTCEATIYIIRQNNVLELCSVEGNTSLQNMKPYKPIKIDILLMKVLRFNVAENCAKSKIDILEFDSFNTKDLQKGEHQHTKNYPLMQVRS